MDMISLEPIRENGSTLIYLAGDKRWVLTDKLGDQFICLNPGQIAVPEKSESFQSDGQIDAIAAFGKICAIAVDNEIQLRRLSQPSIMDRHCTCQRTDIITKVQFDNKGEHM